MSIDRQQLIQRVQEIEGLNDDERAGLLQLLHEQKKYGIVWEDKPEEAEQRLADELPVLTEVKERYIAGATSDAPNHILIEGDNLHALTALSYTHEGKIDVIYIDPPYNTGKDNDFTYNDNIVDEEDPYRHSKWLSFMSRRLKIAKRLLSDRGVIFISIDDHSFAQLKMLCDEIFEFSSNPKQWNFLATLIWNKQHSQQQGAFKRYHEYIYVYSRNKKFIKNLADNSGIIEAGAMKKISKRNPASDFTFPAGIKFEAKDGTIISGTYGESEQVTVINGPLEAYNGLTVRPVTLRAGWTQKKQMQSWIDGLETFDSKGQKVLEFYFNSTGKIKCRKAREAVTPSTFLPEYGMGSSQTSHLEDILGTANAFSNPKPVQMIKDFINWYCPNDGIVLDFFAGSGTTFESTLLLNKLDKGTRQCILVQNNEECICQNVTYHRCKKIIEGYLDVAGLADNTLRYYRTDFVAREPNHHNKVELIHAATSILCIKEGLYEETAFTVGGRKLRKTMVRCFTNGKRDMLIVYEPAVISLIVEELKKWDGKEQVKIYVFSEGQYAYNDDFREVIGKVELCALPDAIYQAYRRVMPKRKAKELPHIDLNEDEVEEAFNDNYTYNDEKGGEA